MAQTSFNSAALFILFWMVLMMTSLVTLVFAIKPVLCSPRHHDLQLDGHFGVRIGWWVCRRKLPNCSTRSGDTTPSRPSSYTRRRPCWAFVIGVSVGFAIDRLLERWLSGAKWRPRV